MLVLLGGYLVSIFQLFSGSGLSRHITQSLFSLEKKNQPDGSLTEQVRTHIARRNPVRFNSCSCWFRDRRSQRKRDLFEKATGLVDNQLDLVHFLQ